jgi:hypothetical protein
VIGGGGRKGEGEEGGGRKGGGGRQEGRREGGREEGGRKGGGREGGDSGGYSHGVLKSMTNDECHSSFGCSHMWAVIFVCGCSLSCMGGCFCFHSWAWCFRTWAIIFVCRHVVFGCGQLSSNIGSCLCTWAVVFGLLLPYPHMMVVVCHAPVLLSVGSGVLLSHRRSAAGTGDVALTCCHRHSHILMWVWAVGVGSGWWMKVVCHEGHGRCGGAVAQGGHCGG